jgi:hypothetical protein
MSSNGASPREAEHQRQVEILLNIIGAMLRMAGQDGFESHLRELDGFGDAYEVCSELKPSGHLRVSVARRGVIPSRAMPTVPLGLLKKGGG